MLQINFTHEQQWALEKDTVVGHRKGSGIDDNLRTWGRELWEVMCSVSSCQRHVYTACIEINKSVIVGLFCSTHYFKLTTKSLGLRIGALPTSSRSGCCRLFLKWATSNVHLWNKFRFFCDFFEEKKVSKLIFEESVTSKKYRPLCRVDYSFWEGTGWCLIDRQSCIFFIFTWWIWFDSLLL